MARTAIDTSGDQSGPLSNNAKSVAIFTANVSIFALVYWCLKSGFSKPVAVPGWFTAGEVMVVAVTAMMSDFPAIIGFGFLAVAKEQAGTPPTLQSDTALDSDLDRDGLDELEMTDASSEATVMNATANDTEVPRDSEKPRRPDDDTATLLATLNEAPKWLRNRVTERGVDAMPRGRVVRLLLTNWYVIVRYAVTLVNFASIGALIHATGGAVVSPFTPLLLGFVVLGPYLQSGPYSPYLNLAGGVVYYAWLLYVSPTSDALEEDVARWVPFVVNTLIMAVSGGFLLVIRYVRTGHWFAAPSTERIGPGAKPGAA